MFAKNPDNLNGKNIPEEWEENFVETLQLTYETECSALERHFEVYGQLFSNEILLITSFLPIKDKPDSPVTIFVSTEISDKLKESAIKKIFDSIIDLTGHLLDDYFSDENWSEWSPNWLDTNLNKIDFSYKITRENIALSIQASQLLNQ